MRETILKLLLGAVIGILISLVLLALIDRPAGYLILEMELPEIFAPYFNA